MTAYIAAEPRVSGRPLGLRCRPHTGHMSTDRSYTRYWVNGGHAWMHPSFTWPPRWILSIPTGSDGGRTEEVSSLDAALWVAAELGLELDVDDWTYALMVKDGVAPATRPMRALRSTGGYPGTGPGDHDMRQVSFDVLWHAPDFIGLTEEAADALGQERGIDLRLIDEYTEAITADYAPARLTLELKDRRVVAASVG
ncbi:MAG: hypothetical protein QOG22_1883 [Pseudonocardiales bacterium]|nr:hypothetical protein [Pseudonocardiales bacterium]